MIDITISQTSVKNITSKLIHNQFEIMKPVWKHNVVSDYTNFGSIKPYGDIELDQHWPR